MNRKFSDIICDNTNIKKIQLDVFRIHNIYDNKLRQCINNPDNDLVKIIKEDNFIKKCDKGFTNLPKCDKCADGYHGYPNCIQGKMIWHIYPNNKS